MPGSHAEEIVGDYYESDDWAESFAEDAESEPDLDLPPLPPLRPEAAQAGCWAERERPARLSVRRAREPWWLRVGEHGDGHSDLGEVVGRVSDGERLADATV